MSSSGAVQRGWIKPSAAVVAKTVIVCPEGKLAMIPVVENISK